MESPLSIYRQRVREQPICTDVWFVETLARARAGDVAARRAIQGSCSSRVLSVVEARYADRDEDDLLDLVQDANVAVDTVVESFAGETAVAFLAHLDEAIERQLQQMALEVS